MQLIDVNKHLLKSKVYKQLTDFKNIYNKEIIITLNARHDDYLTDLLCTTNWPSSFLYNLYHALLSCYFHI